MKLSLQSRYQVRSSIELLAYIVFTFCLLSSSAQRWKRDPRIGLRFAASITTWRPERLLIHLKGPTNWWGKMHTEQSSGHLRYGLHPLILALHFDKSSSVMKAGYRHIVSYLAILLLPIISSKKGLCRVV